MKKDDYFQTHFAGCYYREKNNPTNQKKLKEIIYLGYKNGRILDIGCAYGFFLGEADKYGFETYGIDISKYALGQADKNTKEKIKFFLISCCGFAFFTLRFSFSNASPLLY